MLSEMSGIEVSILDWIRKNATLDEIGEIGRVDLDKALFGDLAFDGVEVTIAVDNLCRLRILDRSPYDRSSSELPDHDPQVGVTALGIAFISACSETPFPPSLH